jgi:hypothetical protein
LKKARRFFLRIRKTDKEYAVMNEMSVVSQGASLFDGKNFTKIFLDAKIRNLFREYEFLLVCAFKGAKNLIRIQAAWQNKDTLSKFAYRELGLREDLYPPLNPNEAFSMVLEKRNSLFERVFRNSNEALKFFFMDSRNKSIEEIKETLIKEILKDD